ncbi:MAG: zinc-dependent metalloprotease [Polyangiaceae bacterium]
MGILRALVLGLLVVTWLGCAQERAPINRVQANALDKSFFVGDVADPGDDPEFYMRTTVVDVASGSNAGGLFTHSDSQPSVRVRWEITEDLLLARLTYELIDGTDQKGARRIPDGQIVAAYTITGHFDIQRDYNPSTGEPLNVIVENDEDRPWFDRQYFRVDWSKNHVTTAYELDAMSQLSIYYAVEWESAAYYVSDPSHPDAPVFDPARGYFDVTNKAWAKPQTYEDPWWGTIPVCWDLGYFPVYNCNPSEVTLRHAFLRVAERDYEPLLYDGSAMEMFGYFTVDRFGYDRRYGVVDDQWRRFASRWNIWRGTHADPPIACNTAETTPFGADPHRDLEPADGTEDECAAAGAGSRCDAVSGLCTLPYRDREVRTIAWHVNREHPEDLFESSAEALAAWDDAMRLSIVAARLNECRRTGGTDCDNQMGWPSPWADDHVPPLGDQSLAEVPHVFVLCHNPVAEGDDAACGDLGTSPRLGDIRYNILTVIPDYELMSPWGIMMDVWDPLTGETIAGSVTVWGATLDRAAATLTDLLGLLNGNIDPQSYIDGEDISAWVASNQIRPEEEARGTMSAEELQKRREAFDMERVLGPYHAGLAFKPDLHPKQKRRAKALAMADQGRLGPGNAALSQRLERLRGTNLEAEMLSPEMIQLGGFDPTGPVDDEVIRRASPFGGHNPAARRAKARAQRLGQASRHSCRFEGPDPDNLLGLAKQIQAQFPAPDPNDAAAVNAHRQAVYDWARKAFNRGVMAHELGHSMGLRHNFAASWDALNYADEYWQLRTGDGAITADCPDGTTDGSACVGPRWRDPLSQAEIDANIQRYATSSVMDYPGDQSQDTLLPGKYDKAALRFAYAGTVDVWQGVSLDADGAEAEKAYRLAAFTLSPGLTGVYWFPSPDLSYDFIHYSRWQDTFGLIGNCAADDSSPLGTRCHGHALDVVDYRDMERWIDDPDYSAYDYFFYPAAREKSGGRVRRGYLFSSDEYADAGNVPSFTGDYGADAYEQTRFLESLYENRYVLDAFRRDRVTFNSLDVVYRTQARYLDNIQQIAKTFAFGALLDGEVDMPSDFFLQDGNYGPLAIAGTLALDLFARQLTRPEPGYYCPSDVCSNVVAFGMEEQLYSADPLPLPELYFYDYQVALGDGRYLHNDYDYTQGYWWGDYQKQVGGYYDKIWATYYLAEAFDYFISSAKEDFADSRYKNMSFATVFPEQVRRLYNALLTNDYDTYAPWVVPGGVPADAPLGPITYPLWSARDDVGTTPLDGFLADPNYAWNEQIYAMVWGSIFFPTNWSSAFIHEARITTAVADTPWPDAEIYAFVDPKTAITYRAHMSGTEDIRGYTRQRSAGARMLEWANRLLVTAYLHDTDVNGDPILDAYGSPQLTLDLNGKPQLDPNNPGADLVLQRYVDNIDQMRQLVELFALPLDDDDLPQP